MGAPVGGCQPSHRAGRGCLLGWPRRLPEHLRCPLPPPAPNLEVEDPPPNTLATSQPIDSACHTDPTLPRSSFRHDHELSRLGDPGSAHGRDVVEDDGRRSRGRWPAVAVPGPRGERQLWGPRRHARCAARAHLSTIMVRHTTAVQSWSDTPLQYMVRHTTAAHVVLLLLEFALVRTEGRPH